MALGKQQIESYREQGFLLLENVVDTDTLVELRETISRFVEQSRQVTASNEMYDLDQSHNSATPRVRRLKDPHLRAAVFQRLASSDAIVDPVSELLGGTVRFDHSKLNFKHPEAAAEIAWHQDWAFYPHTNDDILAVGVMIEDCKLESGPLRVIPGSHRGPVYDHHQHGIFTGAIAQEDLADLPEQAIDLIAPAGSISIHHVRTLHASANCSAATTRPLLLFSYAAVDAFPVFDAYDLDEFDTRILRGQAVRQGRMEALPIRLHLPQKAGADSIYDNQAVRKK